MGGKDGISGPLFLSKGNISSAGSGLRVVPLSFSFLGSFSHVTLNELRERGITLSLCWRLCEMTDSYKKSNGSSLPLFTGS